MELYIESSQAEFDSHQYNTHLYNTHQRQLDPFLRRWVPASRQLPTYEYLAGGAAGLGAPLPTYLGRSLSGGPPPPKIIPTQCGVRVVTGNR